MSLCAPDTQLLRLWRLLRPTFLFLYLCCNCLKFVRLFCQIPNNNNKNNDPATVPISLFLYLFSRLDPYRSPQKPVRVPPSTDVSPGSSSGVSRPRPPTGWPLFDKPSSSSDEEADSPPATVSQNSQRRELSGAQAGPRSSPSVSPKKLQRSRAPPPARSAAVERRSRPLSPIESERPPSSDSSEGERIDLSWKQVASRAKAALAAQVETLQASCLRCFRFYFCLLALRMYCCSVYAVRSIVAYYLKKPSRDFRRGTNVSGFLLT